MASDEREQGSTGIKPVTDPVTRAFESLSTLPALEGGFLRRLLLHAIDDPELATNAALAEHLYLVPQVVRALPSGFARHIQANPSMVQWGEKILDSIASDVAARRDDISSETLAKLSLVSLRDAGFLANFLERRPVSPFL